MRSLLLIPTLVFLLSIQACKKKDIDAKPTIVDSMEISQGGGWDGKYVHFKISNGQLLKDTSNASNQCNFPLSETKYNFAKELLISVPDRMMKENGHRYGGYCDDCNETYIKAWKDGIQYEWNMLMETPDYTQVFRQKVDNTVTVIEQ